MAATAKIGAANANVITYATDDAFGIGLSLLVLIYCLKKPKSSGLSHSILAVLICQAN
jgi:hypothetical protein